MRIRFGDCLLDEPNFFLERAGQRVELRPKVFDLLVFLVGHRQRVVRREELVEALWDTTVVGSGSLSGLVNELRQALGEDGRGTSSIRTVHARGYQFVAPVIDETEPAVDDARDRFVDKPRVKGSDLVARVAAEGVAGVVIEVSPQPEPDSPRIDDLSRHSACVLDLLELATHEGFECHHLRAPDRMQVASVGFARSIVQALLAARGRSALRSALPLPARDWFENAAVFEVAGGFSTPLGGPPDPIGTISHLLADMARKKPLVLVIDAMEDAEARFAQHLVDVSNRLGSAPVLWAIPVATAAIGSASRALLERQACFESWYATTSAVEGLDLALRRHGVEPLPPALASALAAHVGATGEGIECVARWLADRPEPAYTEVVPAPAALEAPDRAQDDARPVHRRMRRVEPAERGSESRWVQS